MTRFLTIDASSSLVMEVQHQDNYIRYEKDLPYLDSYILLELDQLLGQANLAVNNLNAIAVNPGPGNFNGLRVSLVIVKTIAYFTKIPVYCFDSFDTFHHVFKRQSSNQNEKKLRVYCLKAGKNSFFYCIYYHNQRISTIKNIEKIDNILSINWWEKEIINLFKTDPPSLNSNPSSNQTISITDDWDALGEQVIHQVNHQNQWLIFLNSQNLKEDFLKQNNQNDKTSNKIVFGDEFLKEMSLMKCLKEKINHQPQDHVSPLNLLPSYYRPFK